MKCQKTAERIKDGVVRFKLLVVQLIKRRCLVARIMNANKTQISRPETKTKNQEYFERIDALLCEILVFKHCTDRTHGFGRKSAHRWRETRLSDCGRLAKKTSCKCFVQYVTWNANCRAVQRYSKLTTVHDLVWSDRDTPAINPLKQTADWR